MEGDSGQRYVAFFAAPAGTLLRPGTYMNATWGSQTGAHLDVLGLANNCDSSGDFTIEEIDVSEHGDVRAFTARFEQRCTHSRNPTVSGPGRVDGQVRVTTPPPHGYGSNDTCLQ